MMDTAAKRREAYKRAFCFNNDNRAAINRADLLYGDYYPKRNKEKAFLDALENAGAQAHSSLEFKLDRPNPPECLWVSTGFSWAHTRQGRDFWALLNYGELVPENNPV